MKVIRSLITLSLLITFSCTAYCQDYSPKLGPYSYKNKFKYDAENTKKLSLHRHTPARDGIVAYDSKGKAYKLKVTDTLRVDDIYTGSWAGKTGKWALYYKQTDDYYVLLEDLKDIEPVARMVDDQAYERRVEEGKRLWVIVLIVLVVVLILLFLILKPWKNFFIKSYAVFSDIIDTRWPTLIGFIAFPFFCHVFFSYKEKHDMIMQWLFEGYGTTDIDNLRAFINQPLLASTLQTVKVGSIRLGLITFIWLGGGLFLAGILKFLTLAAAGARGTANSYDGGQTFHITSFTPASEPVDFNYGLITRLWLVYSILLPVIYFFVDTVTPSGKMVRQIVITLLIGGGLTALYFLYLRKKERLMQRAFNIIIPILGFMVINLTLILVISLLRLIIEFLKP